MPDRLPDLPFHTRQFLSQKVSEDHSIDFPLVRTILPPRVPDLYPTRVKRSGLAWLGLPTGPQIPHGISLLVVRTLFRLELLSPGPLGDVLAVSEPCLFRLELLGASCTALACNRP
jgi:hypothetical protein